MICQTPNHVNKIYFIAFIVSAGYTGWSH